MTLLTLNYTRLQKLPQIYTVPAKNHLLSAIEATAALQKLLTVLPTFEGQDVNQPYWREYKICDYDASDTAHILMKAARSFETLVLCVSRVISQHMNHHKHNWKYFKFHTGIKTTSCRDNVYTETVKTWECKFVEINTSRNVDAANSWAANSSVKGTQVFPTFLISGWKDIQFPKCCLHLWIFEKLTNSQIQHCTSPECDILLAEHPTLLK